MLSDLLKNLVWRRARAESDFHAWKTRLQQERYADWPDEFRDACVNLAEGLGEAARRTDELFR